MDIIAKLLNDKIEFIEIVYSLDEAKKIHDNGNIPILACSDILKNNTEIENSWNLTSDSISAYIANLLKAKLLIVTNVDGIYTQKPNIVGSKFIDEIDAKKLLSFNETSVDLMLGKLLLEFGMNCFVVNGNYPERVLSLITQNKENQGNSINQHNKKNKRFNKKNYQFDKINKQKQNYKNNPDNQNKNDYKKDYNFPFTFIRGD